MAIQLSLGVNGTQPVALSEDAHTASFASAEDLLNTLHTEDSALRRQINRRYPRLAQVLTVAARLLGSADAAWQWLNTDNEALEGSRTPLEELSQHPRAYRAESLLRAMAEKTGPIEGNPSFREWAATGRFCDSNDGPASPAPEGSSQNGVTVQPADVTL